MQRLVIARGEGEEERGKRQRRDKSCRTRAETGAEETRSERAEGMKSRTELDHVINFKRTCRAHAYAHAYA